MIENLKSKTILRNYLLGQITDESELDLIEEQLLSDEEQLEELKLTESELIDEYVFGKLHGEELENFKRLFLSVRERVEKIEFARNLHEYALNSAVNVHKKSTFFERFRLSPPISFALAVSVLIIGIAGFWMVFRQNSIDTTREKIAAIYSKERPVSGRVVGLAYSPFIAYRGAESQKNVSQIERQQIELELQESIKNKPTSENYHLLGIHYLLEKRFDESISYFEKALQNKQNNAEIRNNLGTAYLEKSKLINEDKTLNLQKSLAEFDRALQSDNNLTEALFNKALVFQEMNQSEKAVETWKQYLEKDNSSEWANEARQNLKNLGN